MGHADYMVNSLDSMPPSITVMVGRKEFDPLHDDAQAMALVKKFDLCIMRRGSLQLSGSFKPSAYQVSQYIDGNTDNFVVTATDLNRAICECVVKMRIKNPL